MQKEIKDLKELLLNYEKAISDFLFPKFDFDQDKIISNVQELGNQLKEKITNLYKSLSAKIMYCILRLSTLIQELKILENQETKIKELEENLEKLKNLADFLGIDINAPNLYFSGFNIDELDDQSSENIIKSLGVSLEEDSEATKLIKIGKALKTLNGGFQEKNYEITEKNQHLLAQIEEQTKIVSENCWKVAFLKAVMDFIENLVSSLYGKANLKFEKVSSIGLEEKKD